MQLTTVGLSKTNLRRDSKIHSGKYKTFLCSRMRGSEICLNMFKIKNLTLGLCPNSAAAGRDREVRGATHNWPSVVRVRPGGISLSHRAPATPVAGRARCALTKVARCTVFPLTHWCGWLPGWRCAVLKKQCGLVGLCFGGRMVFDLSLSQARTGFVAMRQDSNY